MTQTTEQNPVESPKNGSRGLISYVKLDTRSDKSSEMLQGAIYIKDHGTNEPRTSSMTAQNARIMPL